MITCTLESGSGQVCHLKLAFNIMNAAWMGLEEWFSARGAKEESSHKNLSSARLCQVTNVSMRN